MPTHGVYSCHKFREPVAVSADGIGYPRSPKKHEDGSHDYSRRQKAMIFFRMAALFSPGKLARRAKRAMRRL